MLREMGNTDHNHQLSLQDLGRDNWKKSAAKVLELLFDKSNVDLSTKFDELIIVPDGAALVSAVRGPADRQRRSDRAAADLASARALCADRGPGDPLSSRSPTRAEADRRRAGQTLSAR